uniref:hypothetical protein n=1 Tax=Vibrio splendidus TaxID=29497 RepID=UPI00051729F1
NTRNGVVLSLNLITQQSHKEGETKAIEVTYLDTQGNKDTSLDINPRTLGTKSKQLTQFHQGENLNTTIISRLCCVIQWN